MIHPFLLDTKKYSSGNKSGLSFDILNLGLQPTCDPEKDGWKMDGWMLNLSFMTHLNRLIECSKPKVVT